MIASRAEALPALGEVFREHGYAGASLALITQATGLGKGSLYHFFPGGKAEMLVAVLAEIEAWFEANVFAPLERAGPADAGIAEMFTACTRYFRSGRRVCLVGALALGDARDAFASPLRGYFARWIEALAGALVRAGHGDRAPALAEAVVGGIQGAIVLSRALDDAAVFERSVAELASRCASPIRFG